MLNIPLDARLSNWCVKVRRSCKAGLVNRRVVSVVMFVIAVLVMIRRVKLCALAIVVFRVNRVRLKIEMRKVRPRKIRLRKIESLKISRSKLGRVRFDVPANSSVLIYW